MSSRRCFFNACILGVIGGSKIYSAQLLMDRLGSSPLGTGNAWDIRIFTTLPETNIFAPENRWLEYDCFLLGWPIFRGELLVSGRVAWKRILFSWFSCPYVSKRLANMHQKLVGSWKPDCSFFRRGVWYNKDVLRQRLTN